MFLTKNKGYGFSKMVAGMVVDLEDWQAGVIESGVVMVVLYKVRSRFAQMLNSRPGPAGLNWPN